MWACDQLAHEINYLCGHVASSHMKSIIYEGMWLARTLNQLFMWACGQLAREINYLRGHVASSHMRSIIYEKVLYSKK